MPIPLPDLDTRRWADLVLEARGVLAGTAPRWTDFNVSDPGVTLIELLAYVVEQDLYRANRVPPQWRAKLLALAGYTPAPPRPAEFVLTVRPDSLAAGNQVPIEAGTAFVAPTGVEVRTLAAVTPTGLELTAVLLGDTAGPAAEPQEAGAGLASGSGVLPFGPDPRPRAALYLGLGAPPPAGTPVNLWIEADAPDSPDAGPGLHHGVRTGWEILVGTPSQPAWAALAVPRDDTRALTRSGLVVLQTGSVPTARSFPAVPGERWWLRCRLVSGGYDAPPRLSAVTFDAVPARQVQPLAGSWRLAPGATVSGLAAGSTRVDRLVLDGSGAVTELALNPAGGGPAVEVAAPATWPGGPQVSAALLGRADGAPELVLELPATPATAPSVALRAALEVWTAEPGGWQRWTVGDDLAAAGPADRAVALDSGGRRLRFGDGATGMVPPSGAAVVAVGQLTHAAAGNAPGAGSWQPLDGSRVPAYVHAAAGIREGADAEDLGALATRAAADLAASERLVALADGAGTLDQDDPVLVRAALPPPRAVTALDLERIALDVPGTALARARAWPGVDLDRPGMSAPGTVSLVVVPYLPRQRPEPSPGLLTALRRELVRRRVVGTRLVVRGPRYVEVAVLAAVTPRRRSDPGRVRQAVNARLGAYLDPLTGGSAGRGWPFGRTVSRAELMAVIDAVPGVDYVRTLEIVGDGASAGCNDLPIGPSTLVAPAAHQITVERG